MNLAFKFCQVRPELSCARKELFSFGVVNLWRWEVHCGCCAYKMISGTPGLSPPNARGQVLISRFMGLSPSSGSVLTAGSLEPASDSASPSLFAPPPLVLRRSLSLKNK